ncbi:MAG: DNA mismatch repair protein MutS [Flavobacteriia bacterium]|nr:DNA mismatch repair protein MutS [Flavobacteriia bacterium]OJX37089.1 MAG: DNA mismatch repair protein MutS [Flavobacteriia bacterium 40-80]
MAVQNFDQQTLKDLEFTVIREWLTDYAIGDTAKDRLENLFPSSDFKAIKADLQKVKEYHSIISDGEDFPALFFQELPKEIQLLGIKNSMIEQEGFVRIYKASELVNSLLIFFDKREKDFPALSELVSEATYTKEILDLIDKVFDKKGNVKDEASELLTEIRQNMAALRVKINKNFEKELRKYDKEGFLGDVRETFINERRVLSVISSHKRKIKGSVLGSSKTGSLTFIEPFINVDLNNELELLIDDERKEIFRILRELTRELSKYIDLIKAYQFVLTNMDFVHAKAKLAFEINADLPGIVDEPHIELINVYHPILWQNNKLQHKKTLPQNILLDKSKRILVISGPNAGGKSITLKTIGLNQLMLQSGLLVPMDTNSKMCLFQQVKTDIGDQQSIENELSTYSYRLKRMKHFLKVSNYRTLLLLDEFGTGSDPDLGGALAEVFFERLYHTKCFGVITTHYSNIKLKADQLKNAINGCMLFNTETLEPLYKFSIGQPGSSFTFEVAQINGIPQDIIEEAKSRIDDKKVKMDKLLHELQKEKSYLEKLNKEHIEAQALAETKRQEYIALKSKLEDKIKQQQQVMERDQKYVQAGQKMRQYIDRYLLNSKRKDANKALMEDIRKYISVEKTKIEEVKIAERLKQEVLKQSKTKKVKQKPVTDEYHRDKIRTGSIVKMIDSRQNGTVEEINGNLATVVFGIMRVKVELEKLMWVK